MNNPPESQKTLHEKVGDWLSTEGYPLEFRTADGFQKAGFKVLQGQHVRDPQVNKLRETDVIAMHSIHVQDSLLRVVQVIECKWSKDKPWVVFTSTESRMAPAACVAQSIATEAGQAILWAIAGNPVLDSLELFAVSERAGFGGRQAFTKDSDRFYNAMQSVTTACSLLMEDYDALSAEVADPLEYAVFGFPIIVLDGELFEAHYDSNTGAMVLNAAQQLRVHWRGADCRNLISTLDIVTIGALDAFAKKRAMDVEALMLPAKLCLEQLRECLERQSLDCLHVVEGGKGVEGLPTLLQKLQERIAKKLSQN